MQPAASSYSPFPDTVFFFAAAAASPSSSLSIKLVRKINVSGLEEGEAVIDSPPPEIAGLFRQRTERPRKRKREEEGLEQSSKGEKTNFKNSK